MRDGVVLAGAAVIFGLASALALRLRPGPARTRAAVAAPLGGHPGDRGGPGRRRALARRATHPCARPRRDGGAPVPLRRELHRAHPDLAQPAGGPGRRRRRARDVRPAHRDLVRRERVGDRAHPDRARAHDAGPVDRRLPRHRRGQPGAAGDVVVVRGRRGGGGAARAERAGREDRGRHDRAAGHRRRVPRAGVLALRRALQRGVRGCGGARGGRPAGHRVVAGGVPRARRRSTSSPRSPTGRGTPAPRRGSASPAPESSLAGGRRPASPDVQGNLSSDLVRLAHRSRRNVGGGAGARRQRRTRPARPATDGGDGGATDGGRRRRGGRADDSRWAPRLAG